MTPAAPACNRAFLIADDGMYGIEPSLEGSRRRKAGCRARILADDLHGLRQRGNVADRAWALPRQRSARKRRSAYDGCRSHRRRWQRAHLGSASSIWMTARGRMGPEGPPPDSSPTTHLDGDATARASSLLPFSHRPEAAAICKMTRAACPCLRSWRCGSVSWKSFTELMRGSVVLKNRSGCPDGHHALTESDLRSCREG